MSLTKVDSGGALIPSTDLPAVTTAITDAQTKAAASAALLETRAPEGIWINGIPFVNDLTFSPDDLGTYDRVTIDAKISAIAGGGYNPVKVNGHLLDRDIILVPSDLDMPTKPEFDAGVTGLVPPTRTINGDPLSANITLTAGDVGTYTKAEVDGKLTGLVLNTLTINGKPLSADITLSPGDIGSPTVAEAVPRTFTINGQPLTGTGIVVSASGEAYTRVEVDSKLVDYLSVFNDYGLANRPIPLTAGTIVDSVSGSGFYAYQPGTDEDENGDPISTALTDRPTGSDKGVMTVIATGDDTTPGIVALAVPDEALPIMYKTDGDWENIAVGGLTELPLPDIWIPFSDSLVMLTGEAPYDQITVAGTPVDLATKSASFTRASTATYIDKTGVLTTAAVNEPRFEQKGLLIEHQSTNIFNYSEDFSNTLIPGRFYNKENNLTGVKNADGSTTFSESGKPPQDDSVDRSVNYRFLVAGGTPVKPSTKYTISIMGKGGTHQMSIYGTAWAVTGGSAIDMTFPDDKFGIATLTFTTTATANGSIGLELYSNSIAQGQYDKCLAPWTLRYVQVEETDFATSYIPTNGSAATRARDAVSIPNEVNITGTGPHLTISAEITNPRLPMESYPRIIKTCHATENVGFFFVRPMGTAFVDAKWGPNGDLRLDTATNIYTVVTTPAGGMYYKGIQNADVPGVGRGTSAGPADILGGPEDWSRFYGHIRNLRVWNRELTDEQIGGLA